MNYSLIMNVIYAEQKRQSGRKVGNGMASWRWNIIMTDYLLVQIDAEI